MEKIKITLIEEDYKGNVYYDNLDCPAVRATERAVNTDKEISCNGTHVVIGDKAYELPNKLAHGLSYASNGHKGWIEKRKIFGEFALELDPRGLPY